MPTPTGPIDTRPLPAAPSLRTAHLLARTALWLVLGTALALLAAAVLAVVEIRGVPLLAHTSHVRALPDANLARMLGEARAAATEPLDVLIAGSSHAYRGIDPRTFEARGLRALNVGSSAQAPRMTAALLAERRAPAALLIVETYPVALADDGFEGFANLAATAPADPLVWSLAPRFASPTTAVVLAGSAARHVAGRPAAGAFGRYAGRGFVEVEAEMPAADLAADARRSPASLDLTAEHLDALVALATTPHAQRVVFVEMPVSDALVARVGGYRAASRWVEAAAQAARIPFVRLDADRLGLRAGTHFADADHLNAAGVALANAALLDSLAARELLPAQASRAAAR